MQPGPGDGPIALGRGGRHLQGLRRFGDRQTGEELDFDETTEAWIDRIEVGQCLVQRKHVDRGLLGQWCVVGESHDFHVAAAFSGVPSARLIDQDLPHQTRGEREKVRPVAQLDAIEINQPQVRLVNERRRLEHVPSRLRSETCVRDPAQFVIDERNEALQRVAVALLPGEQHLRDFPAAVVLGHLILDEFLRIFAEDLACRESSMPSATDGPFPSSLESGPHPEHSAAAIRDLSASGETALYAGVYVVLKELERARSTEIRRRVLVLLSDGLDTSSRLSADDMLALARRAGIGIYVIAMPTWSFDLPRSRQYASAWQKGSMRCAPWRKRHFGDMIRLRCMSSPVRCRERERVAVCVVCTP